MGYKDYNSRGVRYKVEYKPTGSIQYFRNIEEASKYVGLKKYNLENSFGRDISYFNNSSYGVIHDIYFTKDMPDTIQDNKNNNKILTNVCIFGDYIITKEYCQDKNRYSISNRDILKWGIPITFIIVILDMMLIYS